MPLWLYHNGKAKRISFGAAKRFDLTDAGTDTTFLVDAASAPAALDAAVRWLDNRADTDINTVPDDLCLSERKFRQGKSTMILCIL